MEEENKKISEELEELKKENEDLKERINKLLYDNEELKKNNEDYKATILSAKELAEQEKEQIIKSFNEQLAERNDLITQLMTSETATPVVSFVDRINASRNYKSSD